MDAETREALEAVRKGIAEPHRANNRHEYSEALAALSRIEQTLRDLSEQRDEARKERSDAVTTAARAMERSAALAERVERAERDVRVWMNEKAGAVRRAEAAEAEAARLAEALVAIAYAQEFDANGNEYFVHGKRTRQVARAALSPPTDGETRDG